MLNKGDEKTKVLIADDHLLLAEAVAAMLQQLGTYDVEIVKDFDSAIERLKAGGLDVLLLDLRMPGMHGVESIQSALDNANGAKVVIFSGNVDAPLSKAAVDVGIHGIIEKDLSVKSLDSILNLVLSGQVFMPLKTAESAVKTGRGEDLNTVEVSVLSRAAEGMKNKEIASDLGVSEVTIKMHMRAICRKLGARNRAHAAMVSRELGII